LGQYKCYQERLTLQGHVAHTALVAILKLLTKQQLCRRCLLTLWTAGCEHDVLSSTPAYHTYHLKHTANMQLARLQTPLVDTAGTVSQSVL